MKPKTLTHPECGTSCLGPHPDYCQSMSDCWLHGQPMTTPDRYFLKAAWQSVYAEVTKAEYLRAEQAAGFRSKFGDDHPATAGFTSRSVSGRIEYGRSSPQETGSPKGDQ